MNKYRTASQVSWRNKLFSFPVWVANTKSPKRQNQNCTTHRVILKGSGKDGTIIYDEFFHSSIRNSPGSISATESFWDRGPEPRCSSPLLEDSPQDSFAKGCKFGSTGFVWQVRPVNPGTDGEQWDIDTSA